MSLVLEMVSDPVCPWCWLGLRRVQAAIRAVPDVHVELLFRPFELDPDIAPEGADYRSYMAARLGSSEARGRMAQMREALLDYGRAEGIPYQFDRITRRPASHDAHRLIRWAQGQGLAEIAKEALFSAYFSNGQDISDRSTLVGLAGMIGMDQDIVRDLLDSDADSAKVHAEADLFRQMGIGGVPTYIANRRTAVQGAESAEKLARFIRHAASQMPRERPAG